MNEGQCDGCLYWSMYHDGGKEIGECRRHAPDKTSKYQLTNIEENESIPEHRRGKTLYEWPLTRKTDWCGEFRQETNQ